MTGTAVEKGECAECGADIRDEAAFCYNCGGALNAEEIESTKVSEKSSAAWLRGDINEDPSTSDKDESTDVDKPNAMPAEDFEDAGVNVSQKTAEKESGNTKRIKPKIKMKSAANLRKKPKSFERRKVEVVWEERNSTANIWFIVMSVLITFFVGVLFFLAMYLK